MTEKAIIIDEDLADSDAMAYELDRTDDMWALADYVAKGIEVLDNDTGFFMMCEGGKIDWACHANDAASSIHDTQALADAVQVAIDFAKEHADETLILVTGDHETGGLTIGFAGTDYDTYLDLLENQKISFAKYDSDYVASYKANKTPFETVLADIEKLFGLKAQGEEGDKLVLTAYEMEQLRAAYEKSINGTASSQYDQAEYVLYGTYEPLSVTITHIINNKSGISFTSYSHTGLPVAVLAEGAGSEMFNGYYDNTDIHHKLAWHARHSLTPAAFPLSGDSQRRDGVSDPIPPRRRTDLSIYALPYVTPPSAAITSPVVLCLALTALRCCSDSIVFP
ncbi:MAG: alkaline phosphatase [Flavonifractor plautii]